MTQKPLSVLHVIPAVAPRYGGPSRAIFEMCRPLRERGARVLVATTDADGAGRLPVTVGVETEYDGVPTLFFPRQWGEAYKYSLPLARWLDGNVASFDVVHIHAVFSHACVAAARACRKRGVPYVVRPLGTLDPWGMRQKPLRKRFFMRLGVDAMLRGAAAIQYTATGEKRAVEETLGYGRGVVIPLGINGPSSAGGPAESESGTTAAAVCEAPYVLFLSRLHHKKGLELLLDAFVPLARGAEFEGWKLVVAGDGESGYVESLRRRAEELGGGGRVIFTGWLDGGRKAAALRGAALLALPSYQENFGVCLVEAMQCGVPVLVSRGVNLSPDVEDAGAGWVADLDAPSLAAALRESMLGTDERRRRGAAARRLAARFDAAQTTARILDLYEAVTGRREGARLSAA